jgi:hypothetical protein
MHKEADLTVLLVSTMLAVRGGSSYEYEKMMEVIHVSQRLLRRPPSPKEIIA